LAEIALNLWWTWHPDAQDVFSSIDRQTWEASNHNPLATLRGASGPRLTALARDPAYLERYQHVLGAFDAYMHPAAPTWFATRYPADQLLIAYFCMEFGLHESLPMYSGGLGVLAGDHCKAASDLGLPLVGVGLWYPQGYFHQRVEPDGAQIAQPETIDRRDEPLLPAGADGRDVVISLELPGRSILVRVWRLQVGRISLYLLDPDVPGNNAADRALCAQLYGGDRETRLAQEFILGVGGVRALRALGIRPNRWHMNEGHAAFMGIERIRELVQGGTDFVAAWPEEAASTIFTTHTPVPAGNEVFRTDLVVRYLADFPAQMNLDLNGLLSLAHEEGAPDGTFAMTPLALRLSHRANGVSALHGAVARQMWAKQFPGLSADDTPITSITNGVHTASWIAPAMRALFDHYLGVEWLDRVDDPNIWEGLTRIPDAELWTTHCALKAMLAGIAARRLVAASVPARSQALDPDLLTIGFARRFATYKRATLFFHDRERAVRLLANRSRPVQIVFAGKAHPADGGGQALIKAVVDLSRIPELAGRVLFLDSYDIGLARHLAQGVDVWLNNPERPQEASGTSGQKASLNGVPNCSIRDGWWDEAYNGRNGWAFGGPIGNDAVDSAQLYDLLEQQVVPAYYDRDARGLPAQWLAVMREAIRTVAPVFSAQRMVKEYLERLYR
jgi:starch phosphorylase